MKVNKANLYRAANVLLSLFSILILSALYNSAAFAATIFSDNFESSLSWTRGGDTTWYTGSPKVGTHSVRLRTTGSISKSVSLVGYENISVSFKMGANSLDNNNENVQALYYDGSSWVVFAQIDNGSTNENNLLNQYSVSIPSLANPSSFGLMFKINGSSTNDQGYIDDVVVSGDISGGQATTESLWGTITGSSVSNDGSQYELGTIFSSTTNGKVVGVGVYAGTNESGNHTVRIWNNSTGAVVFGPYVFSYAGEGWREFILPTPLDITQGVNYTVSVSTGSDAAHVYAVIPNALGVSGSNGLHLQYPANAGVFTTTLGSRPTQSYNSNNYLRDIVFEPTSVDTQAPAAPIQPTTYTVPPDAIRVTSSTELDSALNNNAAANIVLADGTYGNSTYFSACNNKLWAENLLGATLTVGLEFGGNWCSSGGGEVHGINFNVSDSAKTLEGSIVYAWNTGAARTKIQDSVFNGNWTVWQGAWILYPLDAVIERNQFYHFADTGMRISDISTSGFVQYGNPVTHIKHVSDIYVDGASRAVPGLSNGTGEMGVWIGNPVTDGVQRLKIRNAAVAGLQTVDNSRDTTFSDLDIDARGQYASFGIAIALEHWDYHNTYTKFYVYGSRGFQCEWNAPEWGGTAASHFTIIDGGTIDGSGWTGNTLGVNLDPGTESTTIRNVKFLGQSWGGINEWDNIGTDVFTNNDFSGMLPGAVQIRHEHWTY